MFLFFFLCKCKIETLTYKDLETDERFLIYVYYERPNYKCPTCAIYESELVKIENIKIKKINFFANTLLASRLCNVFFPSLIIYDHKRLHTIDLMAADELIDVYEKESYGHIDCNSWRNNPGNFVIIMHSYAISFFYSILGNFYMAVDKIPTFVISLIIGFLIATTLYIFISTVREFLAYYNDEKEKDE